MKHILCRKCAGKGTIPNYKHVEDGICFTCNGSQFEEVTDDTTDIVQMIKEQRKLNKVLESEFDLIYNEHKEKMPNNWIHHIRATCAISTKFTRLNSYLEYVEAKKVRIKEIDINADSFFEDYKMLQNDLTAIYMTDAE